MKPQKQHFSPEKADHITILEALESMTDYPAMLRKYKEMGRGKNFLSHELNDAAQLGNTQYDFGI